MRSDLSLWERCTSHVAADELHQAIGRLSARSPQVQIRAARPTMSIEYLFPAPQQSVWTHDKHAWLCLPDDVQVVAATPAREQPNPTVSRWIA